MEKLLEGLKIYFEEGMVDRIDLSDGTSEVNVLNGVPCVYPVFVPRKPWRTPSQRELSALLAGAEEMHQYQILAIVSLPGYIKKGLENIGFSNCENFSATGKISKSDEYRKVLKAIVTYFEARSLTKDSITPHLIYFGKPGLSNVTFNQEKKYYIGLHLDSWEQKIDSQRLFAKNRICINLGKDPRYLIFCNIPFEDLLKLNENDPCQLQMNEQSVIRDFFRQNPRYPIVKIKINPYEAYMAPTENLIHDGYTEGNTNSDINLTLRGYFKILLNE